MTMLSTLALTASMLNSGGSLATLNDVGPDRGLPTAKLSLAENRLGRDLNGNLPGASVELLKPGNFLNAYPNLVLFG